MLPEYEKKSNIGALGLVLIVASFVVIMTGGASSAPVQSAMLLLLVVGSVAWLYGLGCYAIGKGYSAVLALAGVLGLLGLLLLLALPDKHKAEPRVE